MRYRSVVPAAQKPAVNRVARPSGLNGFKGCRLAIPWSLLAGLASLGVLSAASPAEGQTVSVADSVLTFGHSEVQASFSLFEDYVYPTDVASILVLGTVSAVRAPLETIPVGQPGIEVTYVIDGFTSHVTGFWDGPGPNIEWGGMLYRSNEGEFRVYADDSPDLDFADPATFEDGELLLEAYVAEYWFVSGAGYPCPQCYPSHGGGVEFTGGALYPQVSRDGVGYSGTVGQTAAGFASVDSLLSPGTSFPSRGRMWLRIPVTVRETTWGRIKRLYVP